MRYKVMKILRYSSIPALVIALSLLPGCASTPKREGPPVVRELLTTGYCKCGRCCNWTHTTFLRRTVIKSGAGKGEKKKVRQTASGKMAKKNHTIAADTSKYPFGTVMYIPGYGYGVVEDVGGAIKGEHIDLFFGSHEAALKWGKQRKQVQIWFP